MPKYSINFDCLMKIPKNIADKANLKEKEWMMIHETSVSYNDPKYMLE